MEQRVNKAERSKGVLVAALCVANDKLTDLKAECEMEKQMADQAEQEVKGLQSKQQTCSQEYDKLAKVEENSQKDLIRSLLTTKR